MCWPRLGSHREQSTRPHPLAARPGPRDVLESWGPSRGRPCLQHLEGRGNVFQTSTRTIALVNGQRRRLSDPDLVRQGARYVLVNTFHLAGNNVERL